VTSKTARASMRAGQAGGKNKFERAPQIVRFIPLADATRAWVFTDEGRTLNLVVGSEEFIIELNELLMGRDAPAVAALVESIEEQFPGRGWASSLAATEPEAAPTEEA
jgi:hypothetical protein